MKKFNFSKKQIILYASAVISFLIFLILRVVERRMGSSQDTQQMAERWRDKGNVAQNGCVFSPNAYVTEDSVLEFEHALDRVLVEASITLEAENPSARLWADAYSADGKIMLSSDKTTLTLDAIGIGGDFFLFHPLKLVSGAYFSGNDLMQDYCVIDEDTAWQLFGSNDVAGMIVYISGYPHMITGVVERPEGRLEEAAGLDSSVVYVSYQTLQQYGQSNGLNHYEIIMPNPVSDFARQKVQENFGVDEKEIEIVENSSRYSLLSSLKILLEFGTRSMNGKAIIYPYWENIARGYEDMVAAVTLFMLLFLLYPIIVLVVVFIKWWRHKGWTFKDVWMKVKDKIERFAEKKRIARKKKSGKNLEEGEWMEWLGKRHG